jgi:ribosomal protein S18 acetylase RimI-like enzyme
MMRLTLERCFADDALKAVLLDLLASNSHVQRCYERFGFKPRERRMFGTMIA